MKLKLVLLLSLFIIQLAVPGYMIFEQNQILSEGSVYKFKTRPIDPYDPFRGRYVTLTYAVNQERTPVLEGAEIDSEQWVYVLLGTDEEGYATLEGLTDQKPENGKDYLYLETYWGSQAEGYRVKLPFNRYYASEKSAPAIESAVWRRQRENVEDVYAVIRVLNGKAAIEELMVNELPIREYLESQQEEAN